MDKKMTSGEIAKKAGVTQKAVRLYDEKGLLKPTDYSEGNYRLYDQQALVILEKIVALKKIGFSLEEIRDNLVNGQACDIGAALRLQLRAMEEKRDQINSVIDVINRTLERNTDTLDWDDVAGIVQSVSLDQRADRFLADYDRHQVPKEDWYVKIFRSLAFEEGDKVLDLGCGFAKLWRNNWKDIPSGSHVYAYDIHGSWADDFEGYLKENQKDLPSGVTIDLHFEDLEKDSTWKTIRKNGKYDKIIAHYLVYELKDPETVIASASSVLKKTGFFSFNGPAVNTWHRFFEEVVSDMRIEAPFVGETIADYKKRKAACDAMLKRHFSRIEEVTVTNAFSYEEPEALISKMKDIFSNQEKFFSKNENKIREYFAKRIEEDGAILIDFETVFSHCYV